MSASSSKDRDAKLTELVNTMFQRVPKEKRLTVDVVLQLLRTKYASVFPEEYIAERREFVANMLSSFYGVGSGCTKEGKTVAKQGGDADGEDDEESGDDDEEEEDEEEGEEDSDEEDDDEDDDEEFEEDSASDGSISSNNEGEGEKGKASGSGESKATKRPRTNDNGDGDDGIAGRCQAMAACLKFLSHRPRPQAESETAQEYLEQYLIPQFRDKGLDPEKYSKEDARRYRAKREVELLQSDGRT